MKRIINYLLITRILSKNLYYKIVLLLNIAAISFLIYLKTHNSKNLLESLDSSKLHMLFILTLMNISLICIYKIIFKLSNSQLQNLENLGYCSIEEITYKDKNGRYRKYLKFHLPYFLETEEKIYLGSTNTNKTLEQVNSELEELSNTLRSKIAYANSSEIKFGQLIFELIKQKPAPFVDLIKDRPNNLDSLKLFLGKDYFTNENHIIDLQEKAAAYIQGQPGSGKSVLLQSTIEQLHFSNPDYKIVVSTTKTNDMAFLRLIERYKERVVVIDLSYEKPSFHNNVDYVCEILQKINLLAEDLDDFVMKNRILNPADHKVSVLTEKYNFSSELKYIFIFDESADYLIKNKSDSKEIGSSKMKLIESIDRHARKNARFCSSPIFVCSQNENSDALDIELKYFTLRICSQVSTAQQSQALMSNSEALIKPFLKKGCFAFKTDKINYVQTPFYNPKDEVVMKKTLPFSARADYAKILSDVHAVANPDDEALYIHRNYSIEELSNAEFCELIIHLVHQLHYKKEAHYLRTLRPNLMSAEVVDKIQMKQDVADSSDCNQTEDSDSPASCVTIDEVIKEVA